jgi:calcineurin-like phosphoesterase family protein
MKNWVISDLHLAHENIVKYCNRPFKDADEMDEVIINNWNNTVNNDDFVYMLGDWAFGRGSLEKLDIYLPMLKGNIIMVRGNHDHQHTNWYKEHGVKEVHGGECWVYSYPQHIIMSHKPYPTKAPWINIHGHTHNLMLVKPGDVYVNVSVEAINYTPIDLDELIRSLRER